MDAETDIIDACLGAHKYHPRQGTAAAASKGPLDLMTACFVQERTKNQMQAVAKSAVASLRSKCHLTGEDSTGYCKPLDATHSAHSSQLGPSDIEFPARNRHLYQQFIARGLYGVMLERWYDTFPAEQIHVTCTEALKHRTR